jgi:geranylgeranyl pyrophosphate synthase
VQGLQELRLEFDLALEAFLAEELGPLPAAVTESIRYSVTSPGKRIRPLLLMAAYRCLGGSHSAIADLALSVELVHAYSLVHDDLPCMDDDVLRRGRATVHVKYGVDCAVLSGAALMPLAVRSILRSGSSLGLDPVTVDRLVTTLTSAAGASGMVGGQLLDLRAEGKVVERRQLERIHTGKTARLIAACVVMGGIAAGAEEAWLGALERYGLNLGLAFQAVDDILDLRGTSGELGKESGRDRDLGKATYPSLFGVEETERISQAFARDAISELEGIGESEQLRAIASYVIERTH